MAMVASITLRASQPEMSPPEWNTADYFGDDEYDALDASQVETDDVCALTKMMALAVAHDISDATRAYNEEAYEMEAEIARRRAMSYAAFMALQLAPVVEEPTLETPATLETLEMPEQEEQQEIRRVQPTAPPARDTNDAQPVDPATISRLRDAAHSPVPVFWFNGAFVPRLRHSRRYLPVAGAPRVANSDILTEITTAAQAPPAGETQIGDRVANSDILTEITTAADAPGETDFDEVAQTQTQTDEIQIGNEGCTGATATIVPGNFLSSSKEKLSRGYDGSDDTAPTQTRIRTRPRGGCTQHRQSPEKSEEERSARARVHFDLPAPPPVYAAVPVLAQAQAQVQDQHQVDVQATGAATGTVISHVTGSRRITSDWSFTKLAKYALKKRADIVQIKASLENYYKPYLSAHEFASKMYGNTLLAVKRIWLNLQPSWHRVETSHESEKRGRIAAEEKVAELNEQLKNERTARLVLEDQLQQLHESPVVVEERVVPVAVCTDDRRQLQERIEDAELVSAVARRELHVERAARYMAEHKYLLMQDSRDQVRVDALQSLHAIKDILDLLDDTRAARGVALAAGITVGTSTSKKRRRPCESKAETQCISRIENTTCVRAQVLATHRLTALLQTMAQVGEWRVRGHAADGQLRVRVRDVRGVATTIHGDDLFTALDTMRDMIDACLVKPRGELDGVPDSDVEKPWLRARQDRLFDIAEHLHSWLAFLRSAILDATIPRKRKCLRAAGQIPEPYAVWKFVAYDENQSSCCLSLWKTKALPTLGSRPSSLTAATSTGAVPAFDGDGARLVVVVEHAISRLIMSAFRSKVVAVCGGEAASISGGASGSSGTAVHGFAAGVSSPRHLRQLCAFAIKAEQLITRCDAAKEWYGEPLAGLAVTERATQKAHSKLWQAVTARTRLHRPSVVRPYFDQACGDATLMEMDGNVYSAQYLKIASTSVVVSE